VRGSARRAARDRPLAAEQARRREQRGQPAEQFERCQAQLGAPIGLGLGQAIDELVVADLLEPLQCKGRAGAITQQPFQPGAVGAFDAHCGIQRETPAVVPARHVARNGWVERSGAGEPAQHASARLLLHRGDIFRCQRCRLGKVDLPVLARREHPVDHAAVEVDRWSRR
jgi:hypothetical protein